MSKEWEEQELIVELTLLIENQEKVEFNFHNSDSQLLFAIWTENFQELFLVSLLCRARRLMFLCIGY